MSSFIDIEIYVNAKTLSYCDKTLKTAVNAFCSSKDSLRMNDKLVDESLPGPIEFIRISCDRESGSHEIKAVELRKLLASASHHVVTLEEGSSAEEMMSNEEDVAGATTASNNWILPCRELDGAWESLFFVDNTKQRLLRYAMTSLQLGEKGVDPNIVLCNRLILLHGPPGTGKTTICKAVAQKISIRLSKVYSHTQLVEVNCHSLFSKWFSESGKLVSKMFATIRQYALDPKILVIVLIDEVESLTAARQAAISSSEPSDAIRVVNAVLTQLDNLRFLPNVMVLATSNLTEAIDSAFTDRADVTQYVGLPGPREVALILRSCFVELERACIFKPESLSGKDCSELAALCSGLSGRTIRKLPVIAFAEHLEDVHSADLYFSLLFQALHRLLRDRKALK